MVKKIICVIMLIMALNSINGEYPWGDYSYWLESTSETTYGVNDSYWIENLSNNNYTVWAKVSVPAHKNISFTIERESGGTNTPNGDDVFEFFDGFENGLSKWNTVNSPTISNGELVLNWDGTFRYVYRDLGISSNYVIESKWKYTGTKRAILNFPFSCNGGGNGYAVNFDTLTSPGDYCNIYYTSSWTSWSHPLNMQYTPAKDVYHKAVIKISDDTVAVYNDNEKYGSFTINPTNTYIGINPDRGDHHISYVDYIFIRKYANPEPTITVSQINGNEWIVEVENGGTGELEGYQISLNATSDTSDLAHKIYLENPNSQLNISQEMLKNNQIYINSNNILKKDYR